MFYEVTEVIFHQCSRDSLENLSIRPDQVVGRTSFDSVGLADRAVLLKEGKEGVLLGLEEFPDLLGAVEGVQREHDEVAVLEVSDQFFHVRKPLTTGPSVVKPEIKKHRFPSIVRELDLLPVEVRRLEVGGL